MCVNVCAQATVGQAEITQKIHSMNKPIGRLITENLTSQD